MKLSTNLLRQYQEEYEWSPDVLAAGLDSLIDKVGSQLGAIEDITYLGEKYRGIVIVKVMEAIKHPNADRLSLCKVDDNGVVQGVERDQNGYVQVVCGAPNVRSGLLAAWLPPGTAVPSSVPKEPFILEARNIRGEVSNGMLASPKELDLSDNHEGILEVDADQSPGTDFAEAYGLKDEVVLDIENKMFTHRPDCFGIMGLARELAGIQQLPFVSPKWYTPKPDFGAPTAEELPLLVRNELPSLVPRFSVITLTNVEVKPSPVWLQVILSRLGLRPINNLVDLTNYYMWLTGQPLHAYDYDKLSALSGDKPTIVIRNPKPGEKLTLLNGKVVEPGPETITIATDTTLIGIGGVMGGQDTEVDANTTNIVLECANFDMYSVRRTSMALGLFTDAVTRFTKGQSPLQNLPVLARIVRDTVQLAGGRLGGPVVDDEHLSDSVKQRNSLHPPVVLTANFINIRLGVDLTPDQIKSILENVEFKARLKGDEIEVSAPFWRTDIELREDIVEEVGRLYGYDKLPLSLPRRDLAPSKKDSSLEAKQAIRTHLTSLGANEVLTYSFVNGDLLDKVGQDKQMAFKVANALRPELQYYRLSLMPSLLEKISPNLKAGFGQFAIYEIGKTHSTDQVEEDGLPKEFEFTALVFVKDDKLKPASSAYYTAKWYLEELTGRELAYKPLDEAMSKYPVTKPYDKNRAALVSLKDSGEFLGILGEFKPDISKKLKLPAFSAGFEVDTEVLGKIIKNKTNYRPLPRFPKVTQDISLRISSRVSFGELLKTASEEIERSKPKDSVAELSALDIYQNPETPDYKNITLHLEIVSYERTLTDKEIAALLSKVAQVTSRELGAELTT